MTTRVRLISAGACLLASVVVVATAADTIDRSTTFTFNTPVAIPRVTPTFFETEPPSAGLRAPATGAAPTVALAPVVPDAVVAPDTELPRAASPLTMVLATAIILVALAASMQLFTIGKRS